MKGDVKGSGGSCLACVCGLPWGIWSSGPYLRNLVPTYSNLVRFQPYSDRHLFHTTSNCASSLALSLRSTRAEEVTQYLLGYFQFGNGVWDTVLRTTLPSTPFGGGTANPLKRDGGAMCCPFFGGAEGQPRRGVVVACQAPTRPRPVGTARAGKRRPFPSFFPIVFFASAAASKPHSDPTTPSLPAETWYCRCCCCCCSAALLLATSQSIHNSLPTPHTPPSSFLSIPSDGFVHLSLVRWSSSKAPSPHMYRPMRSATSLRPGPSA